MINKIDFAARNLTSNAGLFLLLENAKNNGIFELIDNDDVLEYSGFGFKLFDGVCLPTQKFCFKKYIRKIHVKVLTKMIQYRKFPNNSSAVEEY